MTDALVGRTLVISAVTAGNCGAAAREAARTVAEAGLEPSMSLACATRQEWSVAHRPADNPEGLTALLDALLASSNIKSRGTA